MNARVDPLFVAMGVPLAGKLVTDLFQVVRGDQVVALTADKEFAEQLATTLRGVSAAALTGLQEEIKQLRARVAELEAQLEAK